MTLDDNEVHRARGILDEIFGYENFVATIAWFNKVSPANDATFFSDDHDWIVVYAKDSTVWRPNRLARTAEQEEYYSNPDNDPRGPWNSLTYTSNKTRSERPNLYYEIVNPITMEKVLPPPGSVWRFSVERHRKNEQDNLLYWGKEGKAKVPRYKRFLADTGGVVPRSVWGYGDVGSTQAATLELEAILGLGAFPNAKPTELMERILDIATNEHSVIVDSFAGSGATGHAVLSSNARDRGGRSFVLVECEEYAERVTAERIRKVIAGYATHGIRREELHREGLSWKRIQSAEALVKRVEEVKRKEGFGDTPDLAEQGRTRRFDKINVRIDEGDLVVEGEMRVSERAEGLGGEFTFCTLGEPIDPEGILSGKTLPDFETLGAWLFYTATGATLDKRKVKPKDWYLGEAQNRHLWLVYKPDLGFLKSAEAALTLSLAKKLRERHPDKGHLVFAPAKFLSNKQLLEHGVEYAPLPFALYREG
jgi:adenine-specific DNA-methyltransferase